MAVATPPPWRHRPPTGGIIHGMRWTPRSALARTAEVAREHGARSLWFKIWGELCYRRVGLFELELDAARPDLEPGVPLLASPYLAERDAAEYAVLSPYSDHSFTD